MIPDGLTRLVNSPPANSILTGGPCAAKPAEVITPLFFTFCLDPSCLGLPKIVLNVSLLIPPSILCLFEHSEVTLLKCIF